MSTRTTWYIVGLSAVAIVLSGLHVVADHYGEMAAAYLLVIVVLISVALSFAME